MSIRTKATYAFQHGCGWRRVGKTYIVSSLAKDAVRDPEMHPLAPFMFDPPIIIDPLDYGLSAQGLSFIRNKNGIVDVYDWIGESFYPNAADIWEEMAELNPDGTMHGGSALAQITDDWNQLTPNVSSRFLVHPCGWFDNPAPYREEWIETGLQHCMLPDLKPDGSPSDRQMHLDTPTQMCSALWWQCVKGTKMVKGTSRAGVRTIGATEYAAASPIKDQDPLYRVAVIGKIPITEIHVIAGDVQKNAPEVNDQIKATILRLQAMAIQLPIFITPA